MSATNEQGAARPLLVVDAFQLDHYMRELYSPPVDEGRGYTESFGYKKTDISAGTAASVTASRQILNGDVRSLCGWAIRETTGAAVAAVRLHDGNNTATELLTTIGLAAGAVHIIFPTIHGIEVATGRVFLEVVSGSVEGVIYWR